MSPCGGCALIQQNVSPQRVHLGVQINRFEEDMLKARRGSRIGSRVSMYLPTDVENMEPHIAHVTILFKGALLEIHVSSGECRVAGIRL